jgi:hypothetical protein
MAQTEKAELKAHELVQRIEENLPCEGTTTGQTSIDLAVILVDEIMNIFHLSSPKDDAYCYLMQLEFWEEVRGFLIKR